jgi:hypothetical protein
MIETINPRQIARRAIEASVDSSAWQRNGAYCDELRRDIAKHRIMRHPIIGKLNNTEPDINAQRLFHLEFRHAFAQIFTDALIQLMVTCAQVEAQAGARGKVASRFLLQMNVLDELGFVPSSDAPSDFSGNPELSHYVQFDDTLRQLGLSALDIAGYQPSKQAQACRATFERHYQNHVMLSAMLATSETVFGAFSGPWAKSVGAKSAIDVTVGYHSIHVEKDGEFIDDEHSEDAWFVFRQVISDENYSRVSQEVLASLDTWAAFLDMLAA